MFDSVFKAFSLFISLLFTVAGTSFEAGDGNDALTVDRCAYGEYLELCAEYPHKSDSFTQGLFFYGGEMYETTGRYGKSVLYKNIDLKSGNAGMKYTFDNDIFAEGAVAYKDKLYVLTYKENKVYVINPDTLETENILDYPRHGWGLTTDGEYLIASDGTSELYFMDERLNVIKTLTVKLLDSETERINELEYINGEIWANVWLTQEIFVIDPDSGRVKRVIDFSGLYISDTENPDAVLNGIAYNSESGKLYITGKLWDKMFEFELKSNQ